MFSVRLLRIIGYGLVERSAPFCQRNREEKRKVTARRTAVLSAFILGSLFLGQPRISRAQESTKQDLKDAGHDTKDAAKDTGRATKHAAKKTGHAVKKGTNKAAEKTEEGAQKVKDKTDPHD